MLSLKTSSIALHFDRCTANAIAGCEELAFPSNVPAKPVNSTTTPPPHKNILKENDECGV